MTNHFLITTSSSPTTNTIHSLVPVGQSGGQPIRNTPLVVVGTHSISTITDQYSAGSELRQYTELITGGAIILDHSPPTGSNWQLDHVVVETRNGCVITGLGPKGLLVTACLEGKFLIKELLAPFFDSNERKACDRLQIDIEDSMGNIHTLKLGIDPYYINSICTFSIASKSRSGKSGNTSSTIDERHAMKRKVDELNVKFSQLDIKKSKTQGFCSKFSSLTLQETEDTQEETSNPIILAPEQIQHILFNSASDSFELYDIL